MNKQPIIRFMTNEDIDQVIQIDEESFPNPWPKHSYFYEINENTNSRAWVMEIDSGDKKEIIAMAVLWLVLDEVHIGTIAVHPNYRGIGMGKIFLSEILENAFEEGVIKAYLEVRKSNEVAIHLYESMGFQIDGVRKEYYRDNREDALMMSCEI
ncbi:MAG: ribosomal-protein-alanine N-acetyltransferase [Anaerolineaceae bacterium]|nr:ribosomal-protein-alanine N-acetyltransferase [Anaerolineaceae bacterium]